MFYDVDNLVKANKKVVSNEVEEEDIDPVLYLWDPKNESWWVSFPTWLLQMFLPHTPLLNVVIKQGDEKTLG